MNDGMCCLMAFFFFVPPAAARTVRGSAGMHTNKRASRHEHFVPHANWTDRTD